MVLTRARAKATPKEDSPTSAPATKSTRNAVQAAATKAALKKAAVKDTAKTAQPPAATKSTRSTRAIEAKTVAKAAPKAASKAAPKADPKPASKRATVKPPIPSQSTVSTRSVRSTRATAQETAPKAAPKTTKTRPKATSKKGPAKAATIAVETADVSRPSSPSKLPQPVLLAPPSPMKLSLGSPVRRHNPIPLSDGSNAPILPTSPSKSLQAPPMRSTKRALEDPFAESRSAKKAATGAKLLSMSPTKPSNSINPTLDSTLKLKHPFSPTKSIQASPVRSLKRSMAAPCPDSPVAKKVMTALNESKTPMLSKSAIRSPLKSISRANISSPPRNVSKPSLLPPTPSRSIMRSPSRPQTEKKSVAFTSISPVREESPHEMRKQMCLEMGQQTTLDMEMQPVQTQGIMSGLVFFVDLVCNDGSDGNRFFIPLLLELGAQVVPEWYSNNMAVTHVLFMNGQRRTLEKVIASNGAVSCVKLTWAMDCQKYNCLLPEDDYLIEPYGPLGLHMPPPDHQTPKTPAYQPYVPPQIPSTPIPSPEKDMQALNYEGKTPEDDSDGKENFSPISESTPLLQKTCPPKRTNRTLFRTPGRKPNPAQRRIQEMARRRSAGSPLRKVWGADDF